MLRQKFAYRCLQAWSGRVYLFCRLQLLPCLLYRCQKDGLGRSRSTCDPIWRRVCLLASHQRWFEFVYNRSKVSNEITIFVLWRIMLLTVTVSGHSSGQRERIVSMLSLEHKNLIASFCDSKSDKNLNESFDLPIKHVLFWLLHWIVHFLKRE